MSDREPLTDTDLDRLECQVAQSWAVWYPREVRPLIAEIRRLRAELEAVRETNCRIKRRYQAVVAIKVRDHHIYDSSSNLAPGTFVACTSDAPRRATPGVPETRPDEDDGEID